MFSGTQTIGTRDWEKERSLRSQRAQILDGSSKRSRLAEIERQLERVRIDGEYDAQYARVGALGVDAITGRDFTMFVVDVPPGALETWFWMESDRLLEPVFRGIAREQSIIDEEWAKRVASRPAAVEWVELEREYFGEDHPYGAPPIGDPSTLIGIDDKTVRQFFERHYRPANMTAVLVGDVSLQRVEELAMTYFGRLSPVSSGSSDEPALTKIPLPGPTEALRESTRRCRCPSEVELRFPTAAWTHEDVLALDLLAAVLNGRTGRLHRALVEDQGLAFSASSSHSALRIEGWFSLRAQALEGVDREHLTQALRSELDSLIERGVSERELETAKRRLRIDLARQLESPGAQLRRLLVAAALGDWELLYERRERGSRISAQSVREVAARYLGRSRQWILAVEPR